MTTVLSARGISRRFGDIVALADVSFELGPGELLGILGPNGAGKTTLLDILEGLADADAGEVQLFGTSVRPYPRSRVGVVMQQEFRMDGATAGEYADLFAAIHGVRGGRDWILKEAALGDRAAVPLGRLSGGEAARLFIAASVVHGPDLVFLDEPTAHLDPENKRRVGQMLKAMAEERAVVLTTHDLREADELCDRLLFLVEGKVRALGPRDELIAAVPESERSGRGVEDAFFHFCAIRMHDGEAVAGDP